MIVRLTTDASVCDKTSTAAWAAWAESGRGRFFGGKVFPGTMRGVNSAEMRAAMRGLEVALERGIVARGDNLVLRTDSMYVAGRLSGTYRSRRQRLREQRGIPAPVPNPNDFDYGSPRKVFLRLVRDHELALEVVRASGGHPMVHVDRLARARMIEERTIRLGRSTEAAHMDAFEAELERELRLEEWSRRQQETKK